MQFDPEFKVLAPWVAAYGVTADTGISTPLGDRPAGDLRAGDLVHTRDHGTQVLSGVRDVFGAVCERAHYPVRIKQGALGFGLPRRDLLLGAQHRVLFEHVRVPLKLDGDAVLVRAKSLSVIHNDIAVVSSVAPTHYVQLMLAEQGLVFAEGVPVETVLPDGADNDAACDLGYQTLRSWELLAAVA